MFHQRKGETLCAQNRTDRCCKVKTSTHGPTALRIGEWARLDNFMPSPSPRAQPVFLCYYQSRILASEEFLPLKFPELTVIETDNAARLRRPLTREALGIAT
jgi:hypothetical protein